MLGYEFYKQQERTWLLTVMEVTGCSLDEAFCVLGNSLEQSHVVTNKTVSQWKDVIASVQIAKEAAKVIPDET